MGGELQVGEAFPNETRHQSRKCRAQKGKYKASN